MYRREVDIPYIGGPLDGQREIREQWELDGGEPGSTEGSVYEHRPSALYANAYRGEVHRYTLTRHNGRWEYRHQDELG